jgi:hypothetical protein
MAAVPTLNYARPGTVKSLSARKLIGWVSLFVASITLLLATALAAVLAANARDLRNQINGLPAQSAMINGQNIAAAAQQSKRVSDYLALLERRKARAIKRPLTGQEADRFLQLVETQIGDALLPAQRATIQAELRKPGQQLIDPDVPFSDRPQPSFQAAKQSTPLQSVTCRQLAAYGQLSIIVRRNFSLTSQDADTALLRIDATGAVMPTNLPTTQEILNRLKIYVTQPAPSNWLSPGDLAQLQDRQFYFTAGAASAAANGFFALLLVLGAIAALRGWPGWALYHRFYAGGQISCLAAFVLLWIWPKAFLSTELDTPFQAASWANLIAAAYSLVLVFRLLGLERASAARDTVPLAPAQGAPSVPPIAQAGHLPRHALLETLGAISIAVAVAGLLINIGLLIMFWAPLPNAIATARQLDAAAAKETAAEAVEAASEQRERTGPQPRGLTPAEVADVINKAQSICGTIPDAESKALAAALAAPGQRYIDPSLPVEVASSVFQDHIWFTKDRQQAITAIKWRNAVFEFSSAHRHRATDHPTVTSLLIQPGGSCFFIVTDSPAGSGSGGTNQPTTWNPSYWGLNPGAGAGSSSSHAAATASELGCAAALPAAALSALLLVTGILALAPSRTEIATRLLWFYGIAKVPLSCATVVAFLAAVPIFGPQPDPYGSALFSQGTSQAIAFLFAVAGCVYPIFLFIMLNRSRHRFGSATS